MQTGPTRSGERARLRQRETTRGGWLASSVKHSGAGTRQWGGPRRMIISCHVSHQLVAVGDPPWSCDVTTNKYPTRHLARRQRTLPSWL